MDINYLLTTHLIVGNVFTAGFMSIDIVNSGNLNGTTDEITRTKSALKDLINSLFETCPVAILDWRGDGGILLYDGANGLDGLLIIGDKIINLLSFFNRSRGRLNFLPIDEIHLRVVGHTSMVKNTGNADTLTADALNNLVHHEKDIGIKDHFVITEKMQESLSHDLKKRCSLVESPHGVLGNYYILDRQEAFTAVHLNERKSEEIRDWITPLVIQGQYDELDIFAYSNETLYDYLGPLPNARIRVLTRNWMIEAKEEKIYNRRFTENASAASQTTTLWRSWMKSNRIQSGADMLMDRIAEGIFKHTIDLRFYDSPPIFKGAILRNSKTHLRVAQIGLYTWNIEREEGGSPYIGNRWTSIQISDDNGPQSIFLDAIQSHFELLWKQGKTYEKLKEAAAAADQESLQLLSIEKIWEIDHDLPYLIVVPGRKMEGRSYPLVAAEDMEAMRAIEALLKNGGAEVDIFIKDSIGLSEKILHWAGHIVFTCYRTLDNEIYDHLATIKFPYSIIVQGDALPQVRSINHEVTFLSPIDRATPDRKDYCIVGKCDRPMLNGKLFLIAGLHSMGTWGGAHYLTQPNNLQQLYSIVDCRNFATLIECEFDETQRVTNARTVIVPELI